MVKRHKKLIIFLIILIVLGVGGYFLVTRVFLSKKNRAAGMTPQISTVALTKMDLTDSVSATGTIESASTSTVSTDVQNVTVEKVLVEVGDTVTKGQKLVTFDKSELKEALQEARQDYSDTVSQTSSELSQAYQQLSQARSNYASDKTRLERVVKQAQTALKKAKKRAKKEKKASSTVTDKQLSEVGTGTGDPGIGNGSGPGSTGSGTGMTDSGSTGSAGSTGAGSQASEVVISDNMTVAEARAALRQAKENLASTNRQNQQSIRQAQNSVTQAQNSNKKSIRQAKQSVQDAEKTLKSASIVASMDGTVTALGVEAGATYNGGDAVEISDLSHFQVSTTVDEYDITKVEKGQRVVILTDATGDTEIEGEITFVALTTGSSSLSGSNTTTSSGGMGASMGGGSSSSSSSGYEVIISLSDTDANIRSGMTAKCSIIIKEAADVFAVPYDAIHTNSSGEDVIYVTDSSGQKEITVTKGMETDYYVEVTSSELTENMSVIIPSDATSGGSSSDEDSGSGGFGMFGGGGDFSGGPPSGFSGGSGGFPGAPPG